MLSEGGRYEVITDDASKYIIPAEVDVVWMFNPFNGPVREKVLLNIKNVGRYKKLHIIYANPPKEELTSEFITLTKKIRPDYPRLFLYETFNDE